VHGSPPANLGHDREALVPPAAFKCSQQLVHALTAGSKRALMRAGEGRRRLVARLARPACNRHGDTEASMHGTRVHGTSAHVLQLVLDAVLRLFLPLRLPLALRIARRPPRGLLLDKALALLLLLHRLLELVRPCLERGC